ncbi:MAG: OmpA family protein [Gemmatimonadota bacterium]
MRALKRLIPALFLVILSPVSTSAQEIERQVPKWGTGGLEISASVGLANDEGEFNPDGLADQLRRDAIISGRLGYTAPFNLFVNLEAQNSLLRLVLPGGSRRNLNSWWYGAALGYNIQPVSELQIFPIFGVGAVSWNPDGLVGETQGSINYGVGARYFQWNHVAIRGDLRVHRVPDALQDTRSTFLGGPVPEQNLSLLELSIGITYFVGGPKDSDGDGVYNKWDECPNTPPPLVVDAVGCPIDSDEDGVFDGIDECPGTPLGATVDEAGCPSDEDGDRVLDGLDRCPNTPRGALVDEFGCPMDTDGDGFLDGIDRCPDTPEGAEVNEFGCSPIQEGIRQGELVLHNVYFNFDKDVIRQESFAVLDEVGRALRNRPGVKFEIQGHTDGVGSDEYNQQLSVKRSRAVLDFISENFPDLEIDLFSVRGFGESEPIATNSTPEGRQENRRVVFREVE